MALMTSALTFPLTLPDGARVETTIDYACEQENWLGTERKASRMRYESAIKAREGGYRVSRKTLEFRPTVQDAADPVQAVVDAIPARNLTYITDRNLAPQSVENWYELSAHISDDIRKAAEGDSHMENALVVRTSLWAMTSPADAAQVVLRSEVELARSIGATFQTGQSVVTEEPHAFLFDGQEIAGRSVLSLERIDEARGVAVLRYRRSADPKALKAVLDDIFHEIVREMEIVGGSSVDRKKITAPEFEDTTTCFYEVDLKTGLPTKAECEYRTRRTDLEFLQVTTRTEHWAITQTLKN